MEEMEKKENEKYLKMVRKFLGDEDVEIKYIEKDGYKFYQVGELNIEKAAQLLSEIL